MKTIQGNLQRSYIPKYPTYYSDGSGRDRYINENNGGMLSKDIHQKKTLDLIPLHNNFKSLVRQTAPLKYYSDGTGRDGYILHESGGLERNHKSMNEYRLFDFLR